MNNKERDQIKRGMVVDLKAKYPDGHMSIDDASAKIGIHKRRIGQLGIHTFRFGNKKHCRVEYVAEAMAERQL